MEKKKGMELREKDGTEKRTGVEVEKESIERKCPDSENSSSQPFCLNLAEKRKKKDLKEDELAEERAGRTPSENSVFAHPRKFRKEKRTKKVSFSKLEREASDIGNKCVEEVPSSKLKRKIENSDGLEAPLVKEKRQKLNEASGHPSIGAPKKTTKKPQLQQEGSPSEMSDRSRKSQETSHDKGKKDKEAATTTRSPVKPWRELAVEKQTSRNASLNEKQGDGKEGTHEDKSMENIKSRENASPQKPVQTKEKVPIKLSSELKHAAKSQEEPEDQEEDVASNVEHYTWKTQHLKANLVHGKFTKKEDEELKKAIFYYIREQGLDENEGLAKVLNSSRHKDCRGCWQQVSWQQWKTIAEKLGRYSYSCKDKWREAKLKRSKGKWTLEEFEKLHMLVHTSLRVNAQLKKDPSDSRVDHRHFCDNVNWQFISDRMGTRTHANCLNAWYNKVASSMVSSGDWAVTDDALLLQRIMEDCPVAEEWVEWDSLLEHRSGVVCHKRWQEMGRTLREQLKHSFIDQFEALIQIFAPELLEDEPNEADKKFTEDYDAFTSRQVSNA